MRTWGALGAVTYAKARLAGMLHRCRSGVVTPFALMPSLLNNHINGNGIAIPIRIKSEYGLSEGDFGTIHPSVSCNACCLYCTRFDYFSLPVHGITQVAGIANRKITTCNQLTDTDNSHAAEPAFTPEHSTAASHPSRPIGL